MSLTPYHDHLDVCRWCADHPLNLCKVGAALIEEEARIVNHDAFRWVCITCGRTDPRAGATWGCVTCLNRLHRT